jgi:hypothetical protein
MTQYQRDCMEEVRKQTSAQERMAAALEKRSTA